MSIQSSRDQVLKLVGELGVARYRDFNEAGIHHQYVRDACKSGAIEKVGRGTYALPGGARNPQHRIAEACKRIPQGVVCLLSALWFHGLVASEPENLWMAVDRKAFTPQVRDLPIRVVRFSGDALTQGVVNLRIEGVPVRVYSPMKTVADCFKYADKIGTEVGSTALAAAIDNNKYNRQKLLRFAEICRVKQAIAAFERARKDPVQMELLEEHEVPPQPGRIWDRDTLAREVWVEPIRQLAKKYGVSDVAIHKHCKKMGIALPGRGYWARQARL